MAIGKIIKDLLAARRLIGWRRGLQIRWRYDSVGDRSRR